MTPIGDYVRKYDCFFSPKILHFFGKLMRARFAHSMPKTLQNCTTDKSRVFIVLTFQLSAPFIRGDNSHCLVLEINQRSQLLLKASVIYISEVVRFVSGFLLVIKATKYDRYHTFTTGEIYKACNFSGLGAYWSFGNSAKTM